MAPRAPRVLWSTARNGALCNAGNGSSNCTKLHPRGAGAGPERAEHGGCPHIVPFHDGAPTKSHNNRPGRRSPPALQRAYVCVRVSACVCMCDPVRMSARAQTPILIKARQRVGPARQMEAPLDGERPPRPSTPASPGWPSSAGPSTTAGRASDNQSGCNDDVIAVPPHTHDALRGAHRAPVTQPPRRASSPRVVRAAYPASVSL